MTRAIVLLSLLLAMGGILSHQPAASQEPATAATGPPDHAIEAFARDHGIGVDEAQRRLNRRAELAPIIQGLAEKFSASYAGTEIIYEPEYRFVVHFAGTTPPQAHKALDLLPDATARGGALMSEIAAAQLTETLAQLLSNSKDVQDSGVWTDPRDGVTYVTIQPADGFDTDKIRLPKDLGDADIRYEFVDGPVTLLTGNVYGGGKGDACTYAFTATRYGVSGILGAGHGGGCRDETRYYYHSGASTNASFVVAHVGYYGDFSFYTVNGTEVDDYYWNTGQITDVASVVWDVWYGDYVCHWGKTTGRSCSYVAGWNYCSSGYVCKQVWTTDRIDQSGDSGGPWYMGGDKSKALGVHRGHGTISGSQRSIFSMARYARNAIAADVKTY